LIATCIQHAVQATNPWALHYVNGDISSQWEGSLAPTKFGPYKIETTEPTAKNGIVNEVRGRPNMPNLVTIHSNMTSGQIG